MLHGQFNNSIISTQPTRNDFDKLASLYELSLFKFNTNLDPSLNPCQNLSCYQIRSRYFSPHSFEQIKTKFSSSDRSTSFSVFHNSIVSLTANQETLQTHILDELDFQFDVIGISETKITNSNSDKSIPTIPGYH